MNLNLFTFGKEMGQECRLYAKDAPEKQIATILFYKLGAAFRATAGYGPSTLDILIPYGSPVYRLSEKPLSALMLFDFYYATIGICEGTPIKKLIAMAGLEELITALKTENFFVRSGGLLIGQRVNAELSPTGRDSVMVNDCIQLDIEEYQSRVALVDLTLNASEANRSEVFGIVQNAVSQNKALHYESTECRHEEKWGLMDEPRDAMHIYLTVNLDRCCVVSPCHDMYLERFMAATKDYSKRVVQHKKRSAEKRLMDDMCGEYGMLGEYNWEDDLADVDPGKNKSYTQSCKEWCAMRRALLQFLLAGVYPDFQWRMSEAKEPEPSLSDEEARAYIREAITMYL